MTSLELGLRAESGRCARTIWIKAPGAQLHAWLVTPATDPPWPLVVMAHGWAAVKEMNLDIFAAAMCDAGLAALVFDHRGFGASTGASFDINPEKQILDYQDALGFAARLPEIDEGRLGVWGTSLSGGHVLRLAAQDRRIRAAIAQVPTISGAEAILRRHGPQSLETLRETWARERSRLRAGAPPTYIEAASLAGREIHGVRSPHRPPPVAVEELPPAPTGNYSDDERWRFYMELPEPRRRTWRNITTLTSQERYAAYEPGAAVGDITIPLMVIYADRDAVTPTDLIEQALAGAGTSVSSFRVEGGHYSVYGLHRQRCALAAASFLADQLLGHAR